MQIYELSEKYQDYLADESKLQGMAQSISFPESEQEVRTLTAYCRQNGVPITIQGGKTGLSGGAVPQTGHLMNLSRMNHIKGLETRDGQQLLIVEAGVTLADVHRYLLSAAKNKMWVPSPTEELCTVGGIIANGAKGISSYHYGDTARFLHRVRVVRADGSVEEIGRGRELALLTGSEGTLGVITEAALILTDKPESIWGIAFFFEDPEQAWACADAMREETAAQDRAWVAALEYLDGTAMELVSRRRETSTKLQTLPDIHEQHRAMLYLELEGREEEILSLAETLMETASRFGSDPDESWALTGETELEKMRAFRHAAPEAIGIELERVRRSVPDLYRLTGDFRFSTWSTERILKKYRELCQGRVRYCVFGHAGSRHLLLNLLPEDREEFETARDILRELTRLVREDGGRIAAEQGIGRVRREYVTRADGYEELRACKRQVDPEGIWNRQNIF